MARITPLAIDLCCGLGGWAEGLLAEGYYVVGIDIERHRYGAHSYPAQLIIQDMRTLHGSQFRDAALIVASPPCQKFSYMSMPWKRGKVQAEAIRSDKTGAALAQLTELFDACFRIQREACEAAGRHIPLIVENVRGAQDWVGRARWSFGSYYLWGDVPALMPITLGRKVMKAGIAHRSDGATNFHGYKSQGMNWSDPAKRGQDFTRIAGRHAADAVKADGAGWRKNGTLVSNNRMGSSTADLRMSLCLDDGIKQGGTCFHDNRSISRQSSSKSPQRKAASALIAKIPLPLARHIARTFRPEGACQNAAA